MTNTRAVFVALTLCFSTGCACDPEIHPVVDGGADSGVADAGFIGPSSLRIDAQADVTVSPGDLVFLQGEPSDGVGSYRIAWVQTTGPSVALTQERSPNPSFTAPRVPGTTELTFVETVIDESQTKATATVKVTVKVNPVMVEAGSMLRASEGDTVTLQGSAAGGDGTFAFKWTQTAGETVTLGSAREASADFVVPNDAGGQTLTFQLEVTSGGQTATDTVDVFVFATPISVNAGVDHMAREAQRISLHGRATGGTAALSYAWTQTAGTPVVITGVTKKDPLFTTPIIAMPSEQLTFRLAVTDGVRTAVDDVNVTVSQHLASASAGPDIETQSNQVVQLVADAFGGTPPYTYAWRETNNAALNLTGANTATLQFGAPVVPTPTIYDFELAVTDALGHVTYDVADVTVFPTAGVGLSAEAGPPITMFEGGLVTTSGRATGGTAPYAYFWSQLPDAGAPQLSLGAPVGQPQLVNIGAPAVNATGTAMLQLRVRDALIGEETDVTRVDVVNLDFAVNAGADRTVLVGDQVQLHAGVTEARGATQFTWTHDGGVAHLSNFVSDSPTFTPSAAGTLVFTVAARDLINSASDEVVITVEAPPVTVTAGNSQRVQPGASVYLHGSVTGGVAPFTYAWSRTGMGPAVQLADAASLNPHFVAPAVASATALTFELKVTDAANTVQTATVTVDVAPQPILVNAGAAQEVFIGAGVSLHGTASGGSPPLTSRWEAVGSTLTFTNGTTLNASFSAPAMPGDLTLKLIVTDAGGQTAEATTTVKVKQQAAPRPPMGTMPTRTYGPPPPGLNAVVCGDIATQTPCDDLDLVLAAPTRCPNDKPYAMNTIIQRGADVKEYRRCVDEPTCDNLWYQTTSDKQLCLHFDPAVVIDELNCHLCCYGDMCNVDRNPPDDLLYRP